MNPLDPIQVLALPGRSVGVEAAKNEVPTLSRRAFLAATAVLPLAGCARKRRYTGTIKGANSSFGHRLKEGNLPPVTSEAAHRVVIVGGGVAGLAAAWQLKKRGFGDFVLLELEAEVGGNSVSGANRVSAFPWGAHYVPLPGPQAVEVIALFEELGIIVGRNAEGIPVYREEFLCADPMERLFFHGRWQEGLVPTLGLGPEERRQFELFFARMNELKAAHGSDGRPAFAIPVDRSSGDPALRSLDLLSMAQWLVREGFTAAPLVWYVNYCCRDDYGAGLERVSAWAGLHYFAARGGLAANAASHSVVTWPEGNGWLVAKLRFRAEEQIRRGSAVVQVRQHGEGAIVDCLQERGDARSQLRCERLIFAAPRFIARRVLADWPDADRFAKLDYGPWLIANLTLDSRPGGPGAELAWDNVQYNSPSLGYVVATHQHLHPFPRETVLTYYQPLDHTDPVSARTEAQGLSYEDWCDRILTDLRRCHPDIETHLTHLDIWLWGHGMITPVPGFLWSETRARMAEKVGCIHFAHSDMSGLSIFEEAFIRGVRAADAVLDELRFA